jgi:HAD superfamily hydrolase (TIGR01549 family)
MDNNGICRTIPRMNVTAMIFDLDGTITQSYFDFDMIRKEMGGIEGPILEAIEKMPIEKQHELNAVLDRYELDAAKNATLNPNVDQLLTFLETRKIKTGLLTRNTADNTAFVCKKFGLHFDAIVTRDDEGPVKPDPFGYLLCCKQLGVDPGETVMVGDYKFDLQAGKAAGAQTILITTNKDYSRYQHLADNVIDDLGDIMDTIT